MVNTSFTINESNVDADDQVLFTPSFRRTMIIAHITFTDEWHTYLGTKNNCAVFKNDRNYRFTVGTNIECIEAVKRVNSI